MGKIQVGTQEKFRQVAQLAKLVLTIPHSNAGAERVFSIVNKNLTDARSCLDKDTTLNSIMLVKTANLPVDFVPSKQLCKKAKSATRIMLAASQ